MRQRVSYVARLLDDCDKQPCQGLLVQGALHDHSELDLVYLFGYYHQVISLSPSQSNLASPQKLEAAHHCTNASWKC